MLIVIVNEDEREVNKRNYSFFQISVFKYPFLPCILSFSILSLPWIKMLKAYLKRIYDVSSHGDAREESFYPALADLFKRQRAMIDFAQGFR